MTSGDRMAESGLAPENSTVSDATATPTRRLSRSNRRTLARAGLAITGLFVVLMIGFLMVDWLRGTVGLAASIHEQYLIVGEWLDYFLGTSVFWFPSAWRALAAGVMIGVAAPVIGAFLIHRQMALIGETLAHTAFAGVAAGVVLVAFTGWQGGLLILDLGTQGSLLVVALVVSAFGALGLQWLSRHSESYGDVPIAIVLAGSFAIGTLLISWSREFAPITVDVEGFLFGSLAIVTAQGARLITLLSLIVVAIVLAHYKQFVFITFDEEAARVARLPVWRYNTLLVVSTAVVVVGAMQILGVILVAAMLVVPAATASQIAISFRETVALSVIFGQVATLTGLGFSLVTSLPPGGSIVVAAIAVYLLAVFVSSRSPAGLPAY